MASWASKWLAALPVLIAGPLACALSAGPASALSIELRDVAADRIERQRAAAAGALPLPGTPNVAMLHDRLREKGVSMSAPTLIRVFKAESELEIWKEKGGKYVLFTTYPICHWSGTVGPKLRDGDKQAPEGFYTLNRAQTRHVGRWPKSLDIGFPNVLDQSHARTGSNILIHGGCTSVGCFAMTNPVMDEIHQLTTAAIEAGQSAVPVHILPFRMTDANMAAHAQSSWRDFWLNLKQGYDAFERTRRPPAISVCEGRYQVRETNSGDDASRIEACEPTLTAIREQEQWLRDVPPPSAAVSVPRPVASPPQPPVQTSLEITIPAPPAGAPEAPPTLTFSWPLIR